MENKSSGKAPTGKLRPGFPCGKRKRGVRRGDPKAAGSAAWHSRVLDLKIQGMEPLLAGWERRKL